jgi:2-oxoisovalerate dehydrogenase E2 component (dihydrolipoyl transacylase)
MPTTITMPQLGETVTEGTVAQWLKKVGDVVEKYESFVEVSTDKVNAEVPSPVSGTIRELIVAEGHTVPTGAPIAIIDETVTATLTAAPPAVAAPGGAIPSVAGPPAVAGPFEPALHSANGNGKRAAGNGSLRGASPAVRRLAREYAIDVSAVAGTGANGRVTARDIVNAANVAPAAAINAPAAGRAGTLEAAAAVPSPPVEPPLPAAKPSAAAPPRSTYSAPIPGQLLPLTQARRIIAARMVESKQTAPHAWTMVEVDVTNLWAWRQREKDAFEQSYGAKLTLLPFFMRGVVEALAAFPLMNASFTPDGIQVHRDVNLGMAVAVDGNLLVPVIRAADALSIKGLAVAASELIGRARRAKLGPDQLSGGTFTVNNTGANGSVLSAPILVSGQAGIVTMEAVVKRAVVRADDAIQIRSMMNVCLSLDHRVVDGAVASGFLADLKRRLEAMGPAGSI